MCNIRAGGKSVNSQQSTVNRRLREQGAGEAEEAEEAEGRGQEAGEAKN